MEKRHLWVDSLAHGAAHKKIPCVGYECDGCYFKKGGCGSNDGKARIFSCGGMAQGTGEKCLKWSQSGIFGRNAKGKGYGKVSETDGNTVTEALQDSRSVLFYGICFHDVT